MLPKPLRSEAEPWGISGAELSDVERAKLDAANRVCQNALVTIQECMWLKIPWIVENRFSSLLWSLPEYADLLSKSVVADGVYQACMFGGKRGKKQRLLGTCLGCLTGGRSEVV